MMGIIRLLDEVVINQIAAGEVIERPASVVKELVENSLDAGATRVEIEIRAGGRQLIRVTDNGSGMQRDDALLALERHATSKLNHVSDLLLLNTLGFRGEALASIASVSHFRLKTMSPGDDVGTLIEGQAGIIKRVQDTACSPGTTIEISDLFFNLPPRLKYMKAIPTESSAIADIIGRLAMSRPDVSFRLIHGEFEVLFTAGNGQLDDVVHAVLGGELSRDLLPIHHEKDAIRIRGFIGKPDAARSNRHSQYFFVNGRSIRNHILTASIEKAYRTLLPIARFPLAVVFLELPGNEVDVNVHPAKSEVRFHTDDYIFRNMFHAVTQSLRDAALLGDWKPGENANGFNSSIAGGGTPPHKQGALYVEPAVIAANMPLAAREEAAATTIAASVSGQALVQAVPTEQHDLGTPPQCLGGVLDNTYILAGDRDGLVIVDQHAAHERIIYEQISAAMAESRPSQALLVPETLDLSFRQYRIVVDRLRVFEEMGYVAEPFGGNTVIIRAVPVLDGIADHRQLFLDLVDQCLAMDTFRNPQELQDAFLVTMSCRGAIKAGQPLSEQERQHLLAQLWQCANPYTCPHGRPTLIRMGRSELDRRFRRR